MSERDRNRERMPQVAAFVDELRALFGPVTVEYASEGGLELGKRGPVGVEAARTWSEPLDAADDQCVVVRIVAAPARNKRRSRAR